MTKWSAVFIGFILSIIIRLFFGSHEFIGLLIVGFITGYIAHSGALGGLWNAAVAGSLGTIISAILFIIVATVGGSLVGIFGGLTGFTVSGIASLISVIQSLIFYAIVMGITGAVGGAISSKEWLIMELDIKSIIIGMIVTSLFIIMGYSFNDLFYPFAAIGLLYVGYKQTDIKNGVIAGVITAIPIVILAFFGYLGHFSGFFTPTLGLILTAVVIILVLLVHGQKEIVCEL